MSIEAFSCETKDETEKKSDAGEVSFGSNQDRRGIGKIEAEVIELVKKLNSKREQDQILLGEMNKSLENVLKKCMTSAEEYQNSLFNQMDAKFEGKMEKLSATLKNAAQIERELDDFKTELGCLFQDPMKRNDLQ